MLKEVHKYKMIDIALPATINIDVRQLSDWYDNLMDSNYKGDLNEVFLRAAFGYENKCLEIVKHF